MPQECRNPFSSSDMKAVPQSECTKEGFSKTENILVRCIMTVAAATSAQGKEKGKREYSSTTVSSDCGNLKVKVP